MAGRGRPTKYDPAFCELIIDYFERALSADTRELAPIITTIDAEKPSQKTEVRRICAELPTLEGFAHSISVSSKVLIDWSKVHEEFGESYARAKDIQFKILVDRGLTRQYDPTAFAFVAKNITWMADKQQLTGPDGGAIPLEIRVTRVER